MGAFALTSMGRSKDDVRRGIDDLIAALKAVVGSGLHQTPEFRAHAPAYLALIAAATAIHLSGFNLDPRMMPAIEDAIGGAGVTGDGLILLDARTPGAKRELRLKLAVMLVTNRLGGVGIVQNAADEVHQGFVDDTPLEILPCVTLHPGMDLLLGLL